MLAAVRNSSDALQHTASCMQLRHGTHSQTQEWAWWEAGTSLSDCSPWQKGSGHAAGVSAGGGMQKHWRRRAPP